MAIETFCPYGPSGSGKTTQAQELAIEVHRRTGKKTRLASWSGGGWSSIKPAVALGIVEAVYFPAYKNLIEVASRVARGAWPEHPDDPESPLLPPKKQADWADVGALVNDGITEQASCLFSYALQMEADPTSTFRVSSQEPSSRFQDGDSFFAAGGKPHYGAIQSRIVENVRWSKQLPLYIMWTALEGKGKEKGSAIYAPDVIGDALNAYVPSWFDNTLHLHLQNSGDTLVRRMYLTQHTELDGIPYMAKCRPPLGAALPAFLEGNKASIAYLMKLLDESESVGLEILKKRLGIVDTVTTTVVEKGGENGQTEGN